MLFSGFVKLPRRAAVFQNTFDLCDGRQMYNCQWSRVFSVVHVTGLIKISTRSSYCADSSSLAGDCRSSSLSRKMIRGYVYGIPNLMVVYPSTIRTRRLLAYKPSRQCKLSRVMVHDEWRRKPGPTQTLFKHCLKPLRTVHQMLCFLHCICKR